MNKQTDISKQYSIIEAGRLELEGEFIRFKYKIPSYAKKLIGVFPFSEQLCSQTGDFTEVILSLSINNEETVVVCEPFTLGYRGRINKFPPRMKSLNEELKSGQYITGYVECINEHFKAPFDVKVYLVYETEK